METAKYRQEFDSINRSIGKYRFKRSNPFNALAGEDVDCLGFALIMYAMHPAESLILRQTAKKTDVNRRGTYHDVPHFMNLNIRPELVVTHMYDDNPCWEKLDDLDDPHNPSVGFNPEAWGILQRIKDRKLGSSLNPIHEQVETLEIGKKEDRDFEVSTRLVSVTPQVALDAVSPGRTLEELSHAVNERIGRQP